MADDDLEELRRRSAELAEQDPTSDEALEAHAALLAREPTNNPVANRLGIALLNRGRFDDAELTFLDVIARDPGNQIAQGRLRNLPHARRVGAQDEIGAGREESAELAEHDADEVRRLFDAGTENWRAFLSVLADLAPSRRTYEEIEELLGWDRARLRNVIGGVRSQDGEARRPYHSCSPELSRSGEWEAWMDVEQAAALRGRT